MSIDRNADNIQVIIRVRPLNQTELTEDPRQCVVVDPQDPNKLILDTKPESKAFNFDWVGGENTTQRDIFELVGRPLVQTCLEGYNCCIFAYGQTGAGKTYTMQGSGLDAGKDQTNRGLQPRVFDHIFSAASKMMKDDQGRQFSFTCSYLEIYNEQIIDLLEPVCSNLMIREDIKKGVYVDGIKEETVRSSQETINLLKKGAQNRHVGSTKMNIESSRSHSVFTMTIESKKTINGVIHIRSSKFHFVDLAGSERQKSTLSSGERLKEAGLINKSLLILGSVINSLVEVAEGKVKHIGYRDSKLTFLLRDSLGGNSRTCLIANISPSGLSFSETLSTLKFAQRAKQIKNRASINEDAAGNVENLRKELKKLKEELQNAHKTISMLKSDQSNKPKESVKKSKPLTKNDPLNENVTTLDEENLLKENIEMLLENQLLAQAELEKRDENIKMLKDAIEMYSEAEKNYRNLLDHKYSDAGKMLEEGNQEDYKNSDIREKEEMLSLLKNSQLITKTYEENVALKQKLDNIDDQFNPTSTISISKSLSENTDKVKSFIKVVEARIAEKRFLMNPDISVLNAKDLEIELSKLREIHSEEMEKINLIMFEMKQKESELTRKLDSEQKRNQKLITEIENLKSQHHASETNYENRIKDMLASFESSQREQLVASESESQKINFKIIELNDQIERFKQNESSLSEKLALLEQQYQTLNNEKEVSDKKFLDKIELVEKENMVLSSHNSTLNLKLEVHSQENEKQFKRITEQDNLIKALTNEKKEIETILESYSKDLTVLEELKRVDAEKSNTILDLEAACEEEKMRSEALEQEKTKLQEEIDTTYQTLAFNKQTLEEKKKALNDANSMIKNLNEKINDCENTLSSQKQLNDLLTRQYEEKSNELNGKISSITASNEKYLEEILTLKSMVQKLESSLESMRLMEKQYSEDANKIQSELNLSKETNKLLNEQIENLAYEIKCQNDLSEIKSRQIEELEKNNQEAKNLVAQHEQDFRVLNDAYKELEQMNTSHFESIVKLKLDLEESNSKHANLEEKLNALNEDREKLLLDVQNEKKDHELKMKNEIQIYKEKLENLTQEYSIIKQSYENKNNKTEYENEIMKLVSHIQKKEEEYEKLKNNHVSVIQEYKQALQQLKIQIADQEKNKIFFIEANKTLKEVNEKFKNQLSYSEMLKDKILEELKIAKDKINELEIQRKNNIKDKDDLDGSIKLDNIINAKQSSNKDIKADQIEENQAIVSCFNKIAQLVENKFKISKLSSQSSKDISKLVPLVQEYISFLEEKEKNLEDKDKNYKLKMCHSAIIEQEYKIIKAKYNLLQSDSLAENKIAAKVSKLETKESKDKKLELTIDLEGLENNYKPEKLEGKKSDLKKSSKNKEKSKLSSDDDVVVELDVISSERNKFRDNTSIILNKSVEEGELLKKKQKLENV